jgi:3'(2'), 5'-bisphosphate nucleotidase
MIEPIGHVYAIRASSVSGRCDKSRLAEHDLDRKTGASFFGVVLRGDFLATKSEIVSLLDGLTLIASRAAAAILAVPRLELQARHKPDSSPVTVADEKSEAIILKGLAELIPGVRVVSEETTGNQAVEGLGERFLVVDPLDGTREFLAGLDEFTVNIALVEGRTPIAGVVAAPARGLFWRGYALPGDLGLGAERLALSPGAAPAQASKRITIHTRPRPPNGARVLISRSHLDPATDAYVDRLPQAQRTACGSALKFCLVAEGSADVYPRLAPTSEWDIAAGHAVLAAAGGALRQPDGGVLVYGQGDFRVPAFIASGDGKIS